MATSRTAVMFLDDGHPEAEDYASNYLPVDLGPGREGGAGPRPGLAAAAAGRRRPWVRLVAALILAIAATGALVA